jgi:hypothetical protein
MQSSGTSSALDVELADQRVVVGEDARRDRRR